MAIDYLAKDYSSFRQALLDFIPTRLPAWTERSEADIGMMLLELFSATADTLSYMQDRVANEAFLSSATQRRSVAGHLALIGYQMDEGASAYTWLQFQVNAVQTLTARAGAKVSNRPSHDAEPVIVFETLGEATLDPRHNEMSLYTWGNRDCCLPRQVLSAALVGSYEGLKAGDYLLFEDDQGHRDVVRLITPPEIVPAQGITSPPAGPAGIRTSPSCAGPKPRRCAMITASRRRRFPPIPRTRCAAIWCWRPTAKRSLEEPLHDPTPEQEEVLNAEVAARRPGQRTPRQRFRLARAPLAHLDPHTLSLAAPLALKPSAAAQESAYAYGARSRAA